MQARKEGKPPTHRPRRRSLVVAAVAASLFLIGAYLHLGGQTVGRQVTVLGLGLSLGAMLCQLAFFIEEWLHRSASRYRGSLFGIKRSFFGNAPSAALLFLVLTTGCTGLEADECLATAVIASMFILLKSFGVLGLTPVEMSHICDQQKMNVAHGLAWSFYVGYLKLVLPKLQTSVEQYHHQNRNNFILSQRDSWKIHIVVPLSACIPDQLEDKDQRIQFYGNLPETVIHRAGVRNRVYKHSLYAVHDNNKQPHYCLLEYATPLQTLYQMSHESSAGLEVEERRQQVLLFYQTLKDILDDSNECWNRYQLILLDDEHDEDPHLLSKEILKQLPRMAETGPRVPLGPGELGPWMDNASLSSLSTNNLEISSPVEHTYLSSE